MAVTCPYCQNTLSMQKSLKPGKYTPACPKCTRRFLIIVPEEPGGKFKLAAIQSERERLVTMPGPAEPRPGEAAPAIGGEAEPSPRRADPHRTERDPALAAGGRARSGPDVGTSDVETVDLGQTERPVARPAPTARDGGRPEARGPDLDTPMADSRELEPESSPGGMPSSLGGYQILKLLGRGGMGSVYLARQLSLNRNVALKTMKPAWASNATFVARFTREAYAAAQLAHHNVVQIYDFGEDKGTAYFSMEYVEGQTLSGLVREKGRLDAEEAAGYVLQAARGLKFAHDQSMVHRDIKPDNLLRNSQGVVKVADLGLVKTPEVAEAEEADEAGSTPVPVAGEVPGSDRITQANVAMGTPAFMSPEQARDAAHVDARADIYSLGCTLYALVTGRPPFDGRTAFEVISKHQTQPITPPELIARRVPKALSDIILRMTAKKPEDRYPDLGGVIRDLEAFLGLAGAGPFTPREEHATLLEQSVAAFNASPAARMRRRVIPLTLLAAWVPAVGAAMAGPGGVAVGLVSFGLTAALFDFLLGGIRAPGALSLRLRDLVLGGGLGDWLFGLALALLLAVTLAVLGWIGWAAGFGLLGAGLAVAIRQTLDRRADEQRREPTEKVQAMLRSMRLQGLGEDALRQFVCKYSGERWEEFYEALFGYEAKLSARERWGKADGNRLRPRFAPWREPLVAWIDAKLKARREAREVGKLQRIEERSLQSQGENLVTARRKARRSAEAMVATAGEMQDAIRRRRPVAADRSLSRALREAAAKPEKVLIERERGLYGERRSLLEPILGPRIRFLAGAALLAGCLAWMHQNGVDLAGRGKAILEAGKTAVEAADAEALLAQGKAQLAELGNVPRAKMKPLQLPIIPSSLLGLVSSYGAAVAGLILLISSFFAGVRMAFFAIPAAAIPLLGPGFLARLGIDPGFGGLDPSLAPSVIGAGLLALGLLLGRDR